MNCCHILGLSLRRHPLDVQSSGNREKITHMPRQAEMKQAKLMSADLPMHITCLQWA
jgi:hypothetical protein